MTCLTEHDKNHVYQSVNTDVPIWYLYGGIPYALLCLACFVCYCFAIIIMLLQF